jgi:DNA-binding PadR family transcriptional regulator
LERDRLVASSWIRHAGRRRRVYELTAAGAEALDQRRIDWHRFARGMTAILGGGPA